MNELEMLRGLGYEFSYLKKARIVPPHTAPVLVLVHTRGPLPTSEFLGGEFGIVQALAEDAARFINDRTVAEILPFIPTVRPFNGESDFFCNIGFFQGPGEQKINIATLETRERGREIVIALSLSAAPCFPKIPGYPPLKQMQGLLEDYSKVFRVGNSNKI